MGRLNKVGSPSPVLRQVEITEVLFKQKLVTKMNLENVILLCLSAKFNFKVSI